MTAIERIFKNKRVVTDRLLPYGFLPNGDGYTYDTVLSGSGFLLTVQISPLGEVITKTVDRALGEPYTLHLTDIATGGFVGNVRREYEEALEDIAAKCFEPYVFKGAQANMCIRYMREKYGSELEFLWEKFPEDAICRRADNMRWYAVLLVIPAKKLGLVGDGTCEIIDLMMSGEQRSAILSDPRYFPGYHMNKNSWFTVVLDGSVADGELRARIDDSYSLAGIKK